MSELDIKLVCYDCGKNLREIICYSKEKLLCPDCAIKCPEGTVSFFIGFKETQLKKLQAENTQLKSIAHAAKRFANDAFHSKNCSWWTSSAIECDCGVFDLMKAMDNWEEK